MCELRVIIMSQAAENGETALLTHHDLVCSARVGSSAILHTAWEGRQLLCKLGNAGREGRYEDTQGDNLLHILSLVTKLLNHILDRTEQLVPVRVNDPGPTFLPQCSKMGTQSTSAISTSPAEVTARVDFALMLHTTLYQTASAGRRTDTYTWSQS